MSYAAPLSLYSFPRAIVHIDGDAFFASCEQCEKCTRKKNKFGDCGIPPRGSARKSRSLRSQRMKKCLMCVPGAKRQYIKPARCLPLAKARKGMNLKPCEGSEIQIALTHVNTTLPALVPTRNSEAKKAGNDLLFMFCSKKCGDLLKKAVQKERFKVV